jgi:SAM-dependent methyltransferase
MSNAQKSEERVTSGVERIKQEYHRYFADRLPLWPARGVQGDFSTAQNIVPEQGNVVSEQGNVVDTKGDIDPVGQAFRLFDNWHTRFHWKGRAFGAVGDSAVISDRTEHIYEFNTIVPFKDQRILEVGPLEGGNTKQMLSLGAKEVVALEANPECFLKCTLVKSVLGLKRAQFIFGDCNQVLSQPELLPSSKFDAVLLSGVLYHMSDPVRLIDSVLDITDLVYVFSSVASWPHPSGEWRMMKDLQGRIYRGRTMRYHQASHIGGTDGGAVWLCDLDLQQVFIDRGMEIIHVHRKPNNEVAGNLLLFVARRSS